MNNHLWFISDWSVALHPDQGLRQTSPFSSFKNYKQTIRKADSEITVVTCRISPFDREWTHGVAPFEVRGAYMIGSRQWYSSIVDKNICIERKTDIFKLR